MIHKILESGSKKANDPMAAVDYVLGMVDSKDQQRSHAPRVIGGSAYAFLSMAENVTKGRKYLSTTLSDESQADVSKVEYSSAIFRIHRLAGLPVEYTAWIDVLHEKDNSWDHHSLDALKLVGTHKKARFICGPKDYLRFQRLTCLINFEFGWNDPLDPKTFRPARFVETWRVRPMWIAKLDTSIKLAFQNGEIERRSDLSISKELTDEFSEKLDSKDHKTAQEVLRNRTFLIGAGAFQEIWESAGPGIGFLSEAAPPDISLHRLAKVLPRELVNRFRSSIITLPALEVGDYSRMLESTVPQLPSVLQERFRIMGRERIAEAARQQQGVRFLEELLLDVILAERRLASPCQQEQLELDLQKPEGGPESGLPPEVQAIVDEALTQGCHNPLS
jgi:hypothetical protein